MAAEEALKITHSYPVWVGSLAEIADKNVLMAHFRKFGAVLSVKVMKDETGKSKQFGYINYHNQEAAEVAAREMNGIEICGKKIKTKGPSELKPYVSSTCSEKSDTRTLIDCNYFLQGECKPKAGQTCPYRHCEEARSSILICDRWIKRECTRKDCRKLHPGSKLDKSGLLNGCLNRCDSHNAFKCYGQCGKSMCNTHFENENCLIDHIVISRKRPLATCCECNAVFFDQNEQENHVNCVIKTGQSHDRCQMESEPIGVFWDIENCRISKGKSPLAVVSKIRQKFYPGRREVDFMCVCDTTKEKKYILEDLNKAQVNIVHINSMSKNAADDKIKQALGRFALAHKPPATVVVISGDINFAPELSDLRHRHEFKVILLHNKQASEALLQCANEKECFDDFISDIPLVHLPPQVDAINEILIKNLPIGTSFPKIKGRLNTLTCNTGGKVITILSDEFKKENMAIIKFPDSDSARRAVQRLQKEIVFGSEIKVEFNYERKRAQAKHLMDLKVNPIDFTPCNLQNANSSLTPNLIPPSVYSIPSDLKGSKDMKNASSSVKEKSKQRSKTLNTAYEEKASYQNNKRGNQCAVKNPRNYGNNSIYLNSCPSDEVLGKSNLKRVPPDEVLNKNNVKQRMPSNPSHDHRAWEPMIVSMIDNTINNSVNNGIDLLVTNIDESINLQDVKSWLLHMFRELSKITSENINMQSKGNNLYALVTVPKFIDAQTCIANLNNKLMFAKHIKVTLASVRKNMLLKMKYEVAEILLQTQCGFLPLYEFLRTYKSRHQKSFHVTNMDHMKDLVYIDGLPGYQFVCLLHFPVGLMKVKYANKFEDEVITILKQHNRRVPFASIPGLYWSYLKKSIPVESKNGEMIIKIAQNKQVCLLGNAPAQQAIFFKKQLGEGKTLPLEDFENDIIELLKNSPLFSINFNKFMLLYHKFFGREFHISDYGFNQLSVIFNALAGTVKVLDRKDARIITFTNDFKQKLLEDNLFHMLNVRGKRKVPICSLLTAYYIFYGRKFNSRNFGYNSLQSVLASLGNRFRINGTGESKVLVLIQQVLKEKKISLQEFSKEIVVLLKTRANKQLDMQNLSSEYCKYYGRQLKLSELGFSRLNDLVDAISDFAEISSNRDDKVLSISADLPSFSHLWSEVKMLLVTLPERLLLIIQLYDIYKDKMRTSFPLEPGQLIRFMRSKPVGVLEIGRGSSTVIVDCNPSDYPSHLLIRHLLLLLYSFQHFKASAETLAKSLLQMKISVSANRIIMESLSYSELFQVKKDGCLQLTPISSLNLLQHKLAFLIDEQADKQVIFNHLGSMLQKKLSIVFRLSDYGESKLHLLINRMNAGFFEGIYIANQYILKLGLIGKLYVRSFRLLEDFNGSLLLCNFAAEYCRKYNEQLKAQDYGFAKISDLLDSFSGSMKIYGDRAMKVILLMEKLLNPKVKKSDDIDVDSNCNGDKNSDFFIESEVKQKAEEIDDNSSCNISDDNSDFVIESEELEDMDSAEVVMNENGNSELRNMDLADVVMNENGNSELQNMDLADVVMNENGNSDLLVFDDSYQGKDISYNLEWWMEPLPELPQPTLQPELTGIPEHEDLISFNELGDRRSINSDIDADSLLLHSSSNLPSLLAFGKPVNQPKQSSGSFCDLSGLINNNFLAALNEQKPDLVHLLSRRVTPADSNTLPLPLEPESKSPSNDGKDIFSETYSCFPVLESIECQQTPPKSLASLADLFSDEKNIALKNEPIIPKIAANFPKN